MDSIISELGSKMIGAGGLGKNNLNATGIIQSLFSNESTEPNFNSQSIRPLNSETSMNHAIDSFEQPNNRTDEQIGNDSADFNLDEIINKLDSGGFSNVLQSWIGSGANKAISSNDISQILSGAQLSSIGRRIGLDKAGVLSMLPSLLPLLVDKLSPAGVNPQSGFQNEALSMLKNIL